MSLKRIVTGALGVVAITTATQGSAFAGPAMTPLPQSHPTAAASVSSAHASLRLDVGRAKAWVGQAIPVTLRAYFRDVDGVTIEGAPQLVSGGIFTSELSRDPRQATEIIGGKPELVATWTGTVTPSSPGALPLAATLPVRVRYRDAAPPTPEPDSSEDDPFAAFGGNPFAGHGFGANMFDSSFFRHFMEESTGLVHEEAVSLRSGAPTIDVQSLPTRDQPATFAGAVGRFDLRASVASSTAQVSEPVTLKIVVAGEGDLDRVDLSGVAASDDWKVYPPSVEQEPAVSGKAPHRRVFQQVLVPLRGGELTIPPVSLVSFDPGSGKYVTRATSPLAISVSGTATTADVVPSAGAIPSSVAPSGTPPPEVGPLVAARVVRPSQILLYLSPALFLVLGAALLVQLRRRRSERALRRSMHRAAGRRDVVPFYRAAHALIAARLGKRWGVPPDDVSAHLIRERLGDDGDSLVAVLAADEALRFGRAQVDPLDLVPLSSSIERSLRGVS